MKKVFHLYFFPCAFIGIALFLYTCLRAYHVAMTGDEGASFFDIKYMDIGYFFGSIANTHLLNTFLMKLNMFLWGDSELSLRSPNLIAHLFYLIFSYLIVQRLKNSILITGAFIILNTNPFVLEFFALARGYGLSMALMLGSIYFQIKHIESSHVKQNKKFLLLSFSLSMAAVLANYTMINFYISLILVSLMYFWKNKEVSCLSLKISVQKNSFLIGINILFVLLLLPILFRLKFSGMLFVGGTKNFYQDTVKSLVNASLYLEDYGRLDELLPVLLSLFFIAAISVILLAVKLKKTPVYFAIPLYLLIISAISTIAQFYLLKTPFLFQRTAVFLLPLFLLSVAFLFKSLLEILPKFKIASLAFVSVIALICIIHLLNTININHTYTYPSSANVKDMLVSLDRVHDKKDSTKINIGASHSMVSPINYYRITRNLSYLNPVGYNMVFEKGYEQFYFQRVETGNYDYLFFTEEDKAKVVKKQEIELINYYPLTKTYFTSIKTPNY